MKAKADDVAGVKWAQPKYNNVMTLLEVADLGINDAILIIHPSTIRMPSSKYTDASFPHAHEPIRMHHTFALPLLSINHAQTPSSHYFRRVLTSSMALVLSTRITLDQFLVAHLVVNEFPLAYMNLLLICRPHFVSVLAAFLPLGVLVYAIGV